jgi:tyramine---L-glutamate ligase
VQGTGHQPGMGAGRMRGLEVGGMADAAGANQPGSWRTPLHLVQRAQVRPGVGADTFERHDDHARGPMSRCLPAARCIQTLTATSVEREDRVLAIRDSTLEGLARAQRLARKYRHDAPRGVAERRSERLGLRCIGEAGVEPELALRLCLQDCTQRLHLRAATQQRVEVGDIQHARIAMAAQHAGQRDRIAAGAQRGDNRTVVAAIAAHGTHHLALHEVDDGNEEHGEQEDEGESDGPMRMTRVFVYEYLSGGGPAGDEGLAGTELLASGLAMRDALVTDLLRSPDCAVTVATVTAPVPAGAAAVSPRRGEDAFDLVAHQSQLHDLTWLVAPETDGVLRRFAERVAPARWLGCDVAAIALATHKHATLAQLSDRGLTTPLAFAGDAGVHRWVVKPDDGAGALATRVHADLGAAQRDHALRLLQDASSCLEPWVAGESLSLSLLCLPDRCELLSVNRQRIAIAADGTLSFEGVDLNVLDRGDTRHGALAELAERVVQGVPGLRGFVGIDLVWHPQRGAVFIELNPRVTSAYVGLSATLGRNLATELVAAYAPEPVDA